MKVHTVRAANNDGTSAVSPRQTGVRDGKGKSQKIMSDHMTDKKLANKTWSWYLISKYKAGSSNDLVQVRRI